MAPIELIGNDRLKFKFGHMVSRGSFGRIYKCYMDNNPIALKLFLPDDTDSLPQCTIQEIAALQKLQNTHPNILSILNIDQYTYIGKTYIGITMPYFESDVVDIISNKGKSYKHWKTNKKYNDLPSRMYKYWQRDESK